MKRRVLSIGVAFLMMIGVCYAGPDIESMTLDEKKTAHLKQAVALIEKQAKAEDIQWLKGQLASGNEPINILAAILLYKADSTAYRDVLFEHLTVNDYAERAGGKQNIISQDEFVAVVAKIEKQMSEEFIKQNLMLLFCYWYFRDRNEWFRMENDQLLSAARFFRTTSLTEFLGLPEPGALALAGRLDQAARAKAGVDK